MCLAASLSSVSWGNPTSKMGYSVPIYVEGDALGEEGKDSDSDSFLFKKLI